MEKKNKINISENGLITIDNLPFDEKKKENFNVDITLQIYNYSKYINSHLNIYSISLMDIHHKYNGFIISYEDNSPQIGDIINIKSLTFIHTNFPNKIILILKYDIIEKKAELINVPNKLKKIEMAKIKIKESKKELNVLLPKNEDNNSINNKSKNLEKEYKNKSPLKNNNNKENYKIEESYSKKEEEDSSDLSQCQLLSSLSSFSKDIHIYVKCIKKSNIRHYISKSSNLPGKLFSLIFIDKEGFEMGASCFNSSVNVLYDKFKEGKYYEIKNCFVKINDKNFSEVKTDYKIVLERSTIVKEIENNEDFKEPNCNYTKLMNLDNLPVNSFVDIYGYIINKSETLIVNTKYGEKKLKKIIVGDDSGFKVELTLWDNFANLDIPINQYISAKKIRIGEYNNIKRLGTIGVSSINIENKIYESDKLLNSNSKSFESNNFSDFLNFDKCYFIKEFLNVFENNPECFNNEYVKIKGYIQFFKHSDKNIYLGCNSCQKKINLENEIYYCHKCKMNIEKPDYYYIIHFNVFDPSMHYHLTMFNSLVEILFGCSANEYKKFLDSQHDKLKEINNKILFKEFNFIIKGKSEVFNDSQHTSLSVVKFDICDSKNESLEIIKSLYNFFPDLK